MTQSLLKLTLFSLAFFTGTGIFIAYWNLYQNINLSAEVAPPSIEAIALKTTVCQLFNEQNNLPDQLVTFEASAYLIYNDTIILDSNNCRLDSKIFNDPKGILFTRLEPASHSILIDNLRILLEDEHGKSGYSQEVTVKVTGTAKISADETGFRYVSITPVDIKIISPFRKFSPRGAA